MSDRMWYKYEEGPADKYVFITDGKNVWVGCGTFDCRYTHLLWSPIELPEPPQPPGHRCTKGFIECYEGGGDHKGIFYISIDESVSVWCNFCPVCGMKAPHG